MQLQRSSHRLRDGPATTVRATAEKHEGVLLSLDSLEVTLRYSVRQAKNTAAVDATRSCNCGRAYSAISEGCVGA